jgi:5'-nucleotidase
LTLLHNNDGESSLAADVIYKTAAGDLRVGSTSALAAVFDREITSARMEGNAVLSVYAGDSFLPSKNLICSEPGSATSTKPVLDALAQAKMPYDVHVLGNHEFDYGTAFLARYIKAYGAAGKPAHPFISGNLDFRANSDLKSMIGPAILTKGKIAKGKVLGRSYIHIDPVTKHKFGVVSAVTWNLRTISSPGTVKLTSTDLASTATLVQKEINALQKMGVNKIILVSHLQAAANDQALVALLKGVDVAVAGGGDELLQNSAVDNAVQLIPGEAKPVGEYPIALSDLDGKEVPLVTTSGNYKYLGRVDILFDEKGNFDGFNPLTSYPRRVVPASAVATAAGVSDAVTPNPTIVNLVDTPLSTCLAGFNTAIAASNIVFNTDRGSATVLGVRTAETNGGNLVADAFAYSYNQRHEKAGLPKPSTSAPMVAIQNGGGIRQNPAITLPVTGKVGEITRGNTFDLLPFGNTLVAITEVSAAQLKSIFERSCAISTSGGGQFLQVSGMKVVCLRSGVAQVVSTPAAGASVGEITTEGSRVKTITLVDGRALVANGAPVAGAPTVTVVTNNFTAGGGDNYPTLAALKQSALGIDYEVALYDYLRSFPTGSGGLATIPDSDPRYKSLTGEGRFTWE